MEILQKIKESTDFISNKFNGKRPLVGIVLGSGLGEHPEKIEEKTVIPYSEIPHFATSTAIGHKGNLIFGRLGGKNVVAIQGRFH